MSIRAKGVCVYRKESTNDRIGCTRFLLSLLSGGRHTLEGAVQNRIGPIRIPLRLAWGLFIGIS
jgi:hypothetical protein